MAWLSLSVCATKFHDDKTQREGGGRRSVVIIGPIPNKVDRFLLSSRRLMQGGEDVPHTYMTNDKKRRVDRWMDGHSSSRLTRLGPNSLPRT